MKKTKHVEIDHFWQSIGLLLCPECGESEIHQKHVSVFERSEDEEICLVTSTSRRSSKSEMRKAADNPSRRRQGLTISYWCEHCTPETQSAVFNLNIAQHKGSTHVWWSWDDKYVEDELIFVEVLE